jgi:hypothetical protein
VEESEDEDKDSKDDDMARMLLGDGDSGNSEDDESGSDQEDLLGDEHMDDDDDDSGDNEKDAVSGEEESGDVSEGEDDVSEGEDDDVIDKDGKETEGATWEDIYGRTRAPDGRILAGGAADNTAAAARYVPPAMRNKAALQGPDEKKRKELERLKKQVGVWSAFSAIGKVSCTMKACMFYVTRREEGFHFTCNAVGRFPSTSRKF